MCCNYQFNVENKSKWNVAKSNVSKTYPNNNMLYSTIIITIGRNGM